ncbi:Hypothetical predicted protein [Paramuricea clavata]|uniref:Uncharacterized protein n=1 Tax=Paramuricea clavata TaxID=317549 RepID=A0A6S7LAV3_PARCT|nr:Hypothetical predicted protein [Paramuricea clavata]
MPEEENRSMRQGLVELLGSETLEDRVMRLGQNETRNDNQDNLLSRPEQPLDRQNTTHTIPGTNGDNQVHSVRARDIQGTINETVYNPEQANRFRAENAIPNLSQPTIQQETAPTESLSEKMLPTLTKMERPKLQVFDGIPVDYARFKACVKVEIERKGVYDNVEKLKFLLDAVTGSAKSCLKRFIPGSERYKEAWQALDNRFGQPDVVVAAAKKQIDEFPDILNESAEKIREYQELVSELVGVYKELDFAHELKAHLPESYVKRLPTRLCARWVEKVEGKEAKLCELKQRWMPGKKERRKVPDNVVVTKIQEMIDTSLEYLRSHA